MAVTAIYRKSSGEVLSIDINGRPVGANPAWFGVLTDPLTPDGIELQRIGPDGTPGPRRELGFSKIAEPGSNLVRNATQTEINTFAGFERQDSNQRDALRARYYLKEDPFFRRFIHAVFRSLLRISNVQATVYNDLRNEMLAATSLANLKQRIANDTSPMPVVDVETIFGNVDQDVRDDD